MATKTWQLITQGGWNTGSNWSGGTIPATGDDALFTTDIASQTAGVVTASVTDIQPGTIVFADSAASFFPWQLTGSSNINTYGTGTNVIVQNAPAFIWNNIAGTAPLIVSSSGPGAYLALSGSNKTFTGGVQILTGTLRIADDTSLGAVPASVFSSSIIMNQNSILMTPNVGGFAFASTRGIYLSGTGIISSSYTSSPTIYIQGPVSGPGQIIFNDRAASGSSALVISVVLTGSTLKNAGGIRIDSFQGRIYTSGSYNIGSASIEFRNKGSSVGSSTDIIFYQDPSTQVHTMSGDISWTGTAGTGIKTLSTLQGAFTQPQTHVYSGRLTTQLTNTSNVYLGNNNPGSGLDQLLTIKLTGDNSGLRGAIYPAYNYNASVHFIGSQSLPNASAQMRGYHNSPFTTASNSANWIFSGSMTVPNPLETSNYGGSGVGAKLNVAAGSTVTATGRHGLTGSLSRQGSGANLAWNATSFVGPGEWIQSGTLVGSGALVVEPGSRLTLANSYNTFSGHISASNSIVTVARFQKDANLIKPGGFERIFGAPVSGTVSYVQLNSATLRSSSSFTMDKVLALTGTNTIDVAAGETVTLPWLENGGAGTSLTKTGAGTVVLQRVSPTNPITLSGISTVWSVNPAGTDLGLGAAAPMSLTDGQILSVSSSFTGSSLRTLTLSGTPIIDVFDSSTALVWSASIDGTGRLKKTGAGTFVLPSGSNTYSGGTSIEGGFLRILNDSSLGQLPATLDASNIIFNNSGTLIYGNQTSLGYQATIVMSGTRGIYLSGSGIISSSYVGSPSFHVLGPVSGSGQIIFDNYLPSGSALAYDTFVYLTGTNSALNNSGGIRIDSGASGQLYISGSRNIGSSSIEFRNKSVAPAGAASYLYFYQDPSTQVHTMSGDISWTGAAATGAKYLSYLQGAVTSPQTHVYSGRLSTQETNASGIVLGYNQASTGLDKLLTVKLAGNNSGLYGLIYPVYNYNASVHFIGSQSLPNATAKMIGYHNSPFTTASDSANWIFSGSMTVPNALETSNYGATGVGAKLNVPVGNVVTATGRHGLTGSLTRQGSGANLAWNATSFVGPGEWIQSGTLTGAGSLVLEPGSHLTLATNANTFAGFISSSNGTITVGPSGGDLSFGATPGSPYAQIQLTQGAILALSTSLALSNNRLIAITGSGVFDIPSGLSLTVPLTMSVNAGNSDSIVVRGGGSLSVGMLDVTSSIGFNVASGSTFTLPSITRFNNATSHVVDFTNSQNLVIPAAATFSSSYAGSATFHVLGRVTGSGQIIFDSYLPSGSAYSAFSVDTSVYLTGTDSALNNSGGIRIDSHTNANLYTSGSRNIGSTSIEFRNKGGISTGAGSSLYFLNDPSTQVHTMSGDIRWTGKAATGVKAISVTLGGTHNLPQTHIYTGRLVTQETNTSNVQLGNHFATSARDKLLTVKLTGDNSGLYGSVYPAWTYNASVHFVGSQSLPNASALLIGYHNYFFTTASDSANWIFSGSMTVPNTMTSSQGSGYVGAKLNVPAGNVVTATGNHFLSGTLTRQGSGNALAWEATSFVGPGEWIQSGTLDGAGSLVVEPGSRLTIANNANTFVGILTASNSTVTIASGGADNSFGATPAVTSSLIQLTQGARIALSSSFTIHQNRQTGITGSGIFDVASGQMVTHSGSISGDGSFMKDGAGMLVLSGANTFTSGAFINSGTLKISTFSALGTPSSQAFSSSIVFNNSGTLLFPSETSHIMSGTHGIYLSGSGIVSSSYVGTTTFHVLGPVTGSGQIVFNSYLPSGSATNVTTAVYLTGTNSALNNNGGIRIDSTGFGQLYISGSRNIGSSSIEFRNKGTYASGGGGTFYVWHDGSGQTHTISGDISWSGLVGSGTKTLSYVPSAVGTLRPQTHVYTGRLSTQPTNASSVYLGYNGFAGAARLLTVKLAGNNSELYGNIIVGYYRTSVHFIGSQSLPNASAKMMGYHFEAFSTASDSANWVFSGSMNVPNPLETSAAISTSVGAKLNVAAGSVVTATGRHGLTGSLDRRGLTTNELAWYATSFVGPGEWVQSGTLAGAGSLVVEPGSRLTIANNVNTFTGPITASNAVLTIASGGSDNSFGATPALASALVQLTQDARIAFSSSFTMSSNRNVAVTGSGIFDVGINQSISHGGSIDGVGSFRKQGAGQLSLLGANTFAGNMFIDSGKLVANSDASFGAAPGTPSAQVQLANGTSLVLSSTFAMAQNRGFAITGSSTLDIEQGALVSILGNITEGGGASISKIGAGTLILSGSGAFSGGVAILTGAVAAASPNAMSSGTVTLSPGTALTASYTAAATSLALDSSLILSGGSIQIG